MSQASEYNAQVKAIMDDLDKAEPKWYLDWATGSELRDFVNYLGMYQEEATAVLVLKQRIAVRMFNRVLQAGVAANVVTFVSDAVPSLPFLIIHKDSEGVTLDVVPRPTLEVAVNWVRYDMFDVCGIEPHQVEEFDHDRKEPTNTTGIVKQYVVGDGESYEIYQPHTR